MEYGGILCHSEKVLHIQPGSVVDIKTSKTCYKAKSVIITVGKGFLFCDDDNYYYYSINEMLHFVIHRAFDSVS